MTKNCKHCGRPIKISADEKNATVSHMACSMKAAEKAREHVAKTNIKN